MVRAFSDDQIQAIADNLAGTAQGDPQEIEAMTADDCAYFDSLVFRCAICEWWCYADQAAEERGGDIFCEECT